MIKEKISVVIPCFNEERNVYQNIKKISEYLNKNFESFEIIVVNDGSTDKTKELLLNIQGEIPVSIIDNSINEGKGKVVRDGILKSQNEIVMFLDADLAIPIEELDKFVAEVKNGYDLVIASRFVPGGRVIKKVLWHRRIMEKTFRLIRMFVLDSYSVQDTQCGFKVFKAQAARQIFPLITIKRFAFDAEIIFLARKHGLKIKELPITLQNPIRSHVRIFRDPFNMFCDLIKIRINNLKGKYKVK